MKLWGRKRRLYQSHDATNAQDGQVAQRDSVANTRDVIGATSQSWRSLDPIRLSVGQIVPTINSDWGRTLSAWQDPTTTLSPLSHYKSPSAPHGEAEGLAIIKSPFTPPATDSEDYGIHAGSDLALPHRQAANSLSAGNRPGAPVQRISFAAHKANGQNKPDSPSPGSKPIVGYRSLPIDGKLPPVKVSENFSPESSGPMRQTPRFEKESTTFPDEALRSDTSHRDTSVQRSLSPVRSQKTQSSPVASRNVIVPRDNLVRAQRSTQIFRFLKPVQLLGIGQKNALPIKDIPAGPSAELPLGSNQTQTKSFSESVSTTPLAGKSTDVSDIRETTPLVSSKEILSTVTQKDAGTADVQKEAEGVAASDLPLNIQREHLGNQTPTLPLKLGSPIDKIPDSAVSFANLGLAKTAQRVPFIIPERQQEDVATVPDTPKKVSPSPQRPIPSLGPVPLQRLDLAKKAAPVKNSEGMSRGSQSKAADTAGFSGDTRKADVAPSTAAQPLITTGSNDLPSGDTHAVALVGFKKSLIDNDYTQDPYANFKQPDEGKSASPFQAATDPTPVWQRVPAQQSGRQLFADNQAGLNTAADFFSGAPGFNSPTQMTGGTVLPTPQGSSLVGKPFIQRSVSPQTPLTRDRAVEPKTSPLAYSKPVLPKWDTQVSPVNISVQRLPESHSTNLASAVRRDDSWRTPQASVGAVEPGSHYVPNYGSTVFSLNSGNQLTRNVTNVENSQAAYRQNTIPSQSAVKLEPLRYPVQRLAKNSPSQPVSQKSFEENRTAVPVQRFSLSQLSKKFSSVGNTLGKQLFGAGSVDTPSDTQDESEDSSSQKTDGQQTSNIVTDLSQDDLRRLAARVYPHISQKIKAEIEKDRERSGMITGLHR